VGAGEAPWAGELGERCAFFGGRGHGGASLRSAGVDRGDCLETSALCRMDRAPRLRQPKELVARRSLLREGSPCRRSPLTPPAGANSCSSWQEVRCSPPEGSTPLPPKRLRRAAAFPIR